MSFGKRILSLFLCLVFSSSNVWAKEAQYSFNFPEPTQADAQNIVHLSEDLFKKGGLTEYLLNKAAKGQQVYAEKFAPKLTQFGKMSGRFALNAGQSAAMGALQSAIIGSAGILAMAVAVNCKEKKIMNQDDCLKSGVISDNFDLAAKFLLSSGEFYAAGSGGAITMAPVGLATKYLVQNPAGLSFFKTASIAAVTAILVHFGTTFLVQLYKLSENGLTDGEKALAHGLIPRLVISRISKATDSFDLNQQDEILFNKIVGNMSEILFHAPELRAMVVDQWWRLEVMSGRGIATMASMAPSFYFMLKGMIAGSRTGFWMGMLIGGACGLLGGVAMAVLPEEYLREISLVTQGLRKVGESSRLHTNESQLRRVLSYFKNDAEIEKIAGPIPGNEKKASSREKEFQSYLEERRTIRNAYGTIVYEKVYDAQNLINEAERNMYIARGVIADDELLSALAKSLSVNSDGRFTYGNEIGSGKKMDIQDLSRQKSVLNQGPKHIDELRIFIAGEIKSFYAFYEKEQQYFSELNNRTNNFASADVFLQLENERAKVEKLRDKNRNTLFGVLVDVDPMQCYETINKVQRIQYAKASSELISLFRSYGYSENLLLDMSVKVK